MEAQSADLEQVKLEIVDIWHFGLSELIRDGRIGAGHIDFKMVSEFWRPEHLLTIELGPRMTADDVMNSKRAVESLM